MPTGVVLAVALAATGTGCAAQQPADPASDAVLASLQDWAALDDDARRAALDVDSRRLGAFLLAASGLPDATGMTAEELEAAIPRTAPHVFPAPAAEPESTASSPQEAGDLGVPDGGDLDLGGVDLEGVELGDINLDDLGGLIPGDVDADLSSTNHGTSGLVIQTASFERVAHRNRATTVDAKGAALSEITDMVDALHESLLNARLGEPTYSFDDLDDSDGSTYSVELDMGKLTSSSSASRDVVLDDVTTTIDSTSNIDMDTCPNADGEVDGFLTVDGGITVPGPDGKPVKTQISVQLELKATVDDDAWAVDSVGKFQTVVRTGAPGDTPGGMGTVTSSKKYAGTMTINYANDKGTGQAVRARIGKVTGDGSLGDATSGIVSKLQQKALEEAELFWRSGGCIRADVVEDPDKIDRGGYSLVTVEAVSRRNGAALVEDAVAEYTGENKGNVGGKVSPGGRVDTPADFDFRAEGKDGLAAPRFKVTSKQGIGYGSAAIQVGQNGWVLDGVAGNISFYSVKCDGLVGTWEVESTGPEGYFAQSEFTLGEDLRGTYASTVVGKYADAGDVWLTGEIGTYVFHATGDFDPALPLRPATKGECD
ncbi:hypothetical protein DDQ50_07530 [Amnibacterium flavum]|uniref:Uncharacterized protein n=1 Tax=Amnibacterium flavum TaxID=2173173 RepID=A0A2V1HUJ6_9MICO|nr:hypothetical protein DDQ50_07530 [Amnibacterium flavum]